MANICRNAHLHWLPVLLLAALSCSPLCAFAWTISSLGTLGGSYSIATDINDLGQVVGYSENPPHLQNGVDLISFAHAFLSAPNGGPIADLGPSPFDISQANAVNHAGQVVGRVALGGSLDTALVTGPNGAALPSGPFNLPYSGSLSGAAFLVATDINNNGQVLGYDAFGFGSFLTRPDGVTLIDMPYNLVNRVNDAGQVVYSGFDNHAYIWSESEGARALTPSAAFSTAVDINNAGQVVGRADNAGYLTDANGGALNLLGTLGGSFTDPRAVNNLGQVVGVSETADGLLHAFVTAPNGGALIDLETLEEIVQAGWSRLTVAAINDAGQIAGTGYIDGQQRAFFLSPVPEPSTTALMIAGLMSLGIASWRKNGLVNQVPIMPGREKLLLQTGGAHPAGIAAHR